LRLLTFLGGVPRIALVPALPIVAFIIGFGISLGSGGNDNGVAPPSEAVVAPSPEATPTLVVPTATPVSYRTDCAAIRGTDYRSNEEREWFRQNCSGTSALSNTSGGSTAGTTGGSTVTGPAAAPRAGQAPTGDRLVIPSIGVNADVWKATVGSDGVMPDPVGYFNAVRYDFGAAGIGGDVNGGNLVLSGHVDCAACHSGGPGLAVFYYVKNLGPGDGIDYYTADGRLVRYVVTSAGDYEPNTDWSAIVASGTADLTLITCIGTWNPSAREYSLRRVVFARKA